MSQYPQYPQYPGQYPQGGYPGAPQPYPGMPYAQPGAGYNPYANLLGPAKRAGILQIVLGSLGALFGTCFGVSFLVVTPDMLAQQGKTLPPELTWDMMRLMGGVLLGSGAVHIILLIMGILVVKGSKGAAVTAMAFNILLAVGILYLILTGGLVMIIGLGILVWQIVWLAQASSAITQHANAQAQYAQYYAYYSQQQAGGVTQPGQGYPAQPPQQWPAAPGTPPQQQQQWPPPQG